MSALLTDEASAGAAAGRHQHLHVERHRLAGRRQPLPGHLHNTYQSRSDTSAESHTARSDRRCRATCTTHTRVGQTRHAESHTARSDSRCLATCTTRTRVGQTRNSPVRWHAASGYQCVSRSDVIGCSQRYDVSLRNRKQKTFVVNIHTARSHIRREPHSPVRGFRSGQR